MRYGPFRLATQIAVFLLMFIIPVLNIYELYLITGTYYALNVGGLGIADPVVILQAIFASGQLTLPLMTAAVFPILVALILGRVWCGWLCPYLFIADRIESIRRIFRKNSHGPSTERSNRASNSFRANFVRFLFLIGGTALGGMVGIPILNFVSAPGILSTEAMIFVKERSVSIEILFLFVILALQLTVLPRFWCRLFCPTGSVLSLLRTPYTLCVESLSKNPVGPCCKENSCSDVCPMKLEPYRESQDLLCVNCGKCVDACKFNRLRFGGMGSALKLDGPVSREKQTNPDICK